jgi:DNA-binding GntR family transcriptional regulator
MDSNSPAIPRRYLHDDVAARLRGLIDSGALPPGARVNELDLAARFAISRTPLREAIKILATEGLLELLPNRGARVAHVSLAEIEDMLEVLAGLEATAAELACRTIAPGPLRAIEVDTEAMIAAHAGGDDAEYFRRNRAIHDALMTASGNATLQALYAGLQGRVPRARYTAAKTPDQWRQAIADHRRMVVLLRAGRGAALGLLMRRHLRSKKPVLAAALTAEPSEERMLA